MELDMNNSKIKVLLVEDIKIAQKAAVMMLEELNCEIDTADSGTQALKLVNQKSYDIIFMDLGLDDMDGFIVTETIRKIEGNTKYTPIVALTAHSDADIKVKCLKVGIDDFIEKPIGLDNGRHVLEKYVYK